MLESGGWPVRAVDVRSGELSTVHANAGQDGRGDPVPPNRVAVGSEDTVYLLGNGGVYRTEPGGAAVPLTGGEEPRAGEDPQHPDLMGRALAVGPDGGLVLSTSEGIGSLAADGTLTTLAGADALGDDGGVLPEEMAVGPDGTVYFTEIMQHRVRAVEPDGTVTHVAGTGESGYTDDEIADGRPATETAVIQPGGIAAAPDGRVYVSTAHGIRVVEEDGTIGTVLESAQGEGETSYYPATTLETDPHGNLYFTDLSTSQVKVMVRPGEVRDVSWAAVAGAGVLGLLLMFTAVGAVLLRDELGALARNPRRLPVAVVTVVVLVVVAVLDAPGRLARRFGR